MKNIIDSYSLFKNQDLFGRYITHDHLAPELDKISQHFEIAEIGKSVENIPIHMVSIGTGSTKILAWSQMHGNETTTTKAVFDLMNFLQRKELPLVAQILRSCSIHIIPLLNPDGAKRYTRENANSIDLNRDAENLEEVESRILRGIFTALDPDFCFNLHDQRTIFGAGTEKNPATLSFLAPAMDSERSVNMERKQAMQLIAAMNETLQKYIPRQIGRYDDAYNPNCTGDRFQESVPTILFEAGHFSQDYQRESSRKYMFTAILSALVSISTNEYKDYEIDSYTAIPENEKNFMDVVLRNAKIDGEVMDIAVQYEEKLESGKIHFVPAVKIIDAEIPLYGHREIDCGQGKVTKISGEGIYENDLVGEILLKGKKLSIKSE